MTSRTLCFDPRGFRDLCKLPTQGDWNSVMLAAEQFAESGAGDVTKLKGRRAEYRLRAGCWRILFYFEGHLVVVFRIAHRREVYREPS